jgi:hypothetical protein
VGFTFHVPFQSGEGARQPNVATDAQKTTQRSHAFLIAFALSPSSKPLNLKQEVSDEAKACQ